MPHSSPDVESVDNVARTTSRVDNSRDGALRSKPPKPRGGSPSRGWVGNLYPGWGPRREVGRGVLGPGWCRTGCGAAREGTSAACPGWFC